MAPVTKPEENLSGVVKILIVTLIVCLGLWGCARKPGPSSASNERMRGLETRCQKLEQDYRSVALSRDVVRKELAALEEEALRLQKEVTERTKERDQLRTRVQASETQRQDLHKVLVERTNERDDLKQQVTQRSNERDVLANRYDKLRKGVQQLMNDDEGPVPTPTVVPTPGAVSTAATLGGS